MAQYYFDIVNAGQKHLDAFGIDLLDDEEARDQALALLPALVRDDILVHDDQEVVVSARNARGEIIYEATLSLQGRWRPGQNR